MANPTWSKVMDDLHSSTWEKKGTDLVDNIFENLPILKLMREKGKFVDHSGGTMITIPLEYGENETVQSFGRGSKFSIEDNQKFTTAKYDWKGVGGSIVRYFKDEQMNKGEAQVFNLVEKNTKNLTKSIEKKFNALLMDDGSGDANDLEGFKKYVETTPATGTVGGLDASTCTWWRNQHTSMSGLDHTVYLIDYMRTMYDDCSEDGGVNPPTVIVTTKAIKNWYIDEALDSHYYTESNDYADLGIKTCGFNGTPIIWSNSCTAGEMLFLNLDYFELAYDPSLWFNMTDWKTAQDNLERVAQVVAVANLVCSNRAKQGLLSAITT